MMTFGFKEKKKYYFISNGKSVSVILSGETTTYYLNIIISFREGRNFADGGELSS